MVRTFFVLSRFPPRQNPPQGEADSHVKHETNSPLTTQDADTDREGSSKRGAEAGTIDHVGEPANFSRDLQ